MKVTRGITIRSITRIVMCVSFTFGHVSSSQVPHVQPSQPLQRFFLDYPGLTGFIGRIMLSYFDSTTTLEQESKRKRQTNVDRESITASSQKYKRESAM